MNKLLIAMPLAILAVAVASTPAQAADSSPFYLLFTNASSHPFKVSGMTVGGKVCPACTDRSFAPGAASLVKLAALGSAHLKMTISGDGNGKCEYDLAADGSMSSTGDCGASPKIAYAGGVHSDLMFDTKGTPTFDLFYGYDPVPGK